MCYWKKWSHSRNQPLNLIAHVTSFFKIAQFFAAFASCTSLFEFNKKSHFFFWSPFFSNQPEPDLLVTKKDRDRSIPRKYFLVIFSSSLSTIAIRRSKTMWRYVSASSPSVDCLWTIRGDEFFFVGLRGWGVWGGRRGLVDVRGPWNLVENQPTL